MTLADLSISKSDQRIDGKFVGKLIDYVRGGDARNVRRLLNKHRSSATALCVRPLRAAHRWSALTSAADFGHDDVVRLVDECRDVERGEAERVLNRKVCQFVCL